MSEPATTLPAMARPGITLGEVVLHGRRITYRTCGTHGPTVLLVHGIAGNAQAWDAVMPTLGERCRVIAPDLLGHGDSAKPASGDYSLGAYASDLRDLATALGHERVTIVGHSLGGGVSLQFAYQFPERCERLVLVSSGGLGTELHVLLRAASLPGAEYVLPLLCSDRLHAIATGAQHILGRLGLRPMPDIHEGWDSFRSLKAPEARAAFLKTVRGVIDISGQRVSAADRLYLAAEIPTLLVWGRRDAIIPVAHGEAAHERIPGSRLEVLEGVGHFPHREVPEVLARLLVEFIEHSEPAGIEPGQLRELLLQQAASGPIAGQTVA